MITLILILLCIGCTKKDDITSQDPTPTLTPTSVVILTPTPTPTKPGSYQDSLTVSNDPSIQNILEIYYKAKADGNLTTLDALTIGRSFLDEASFSALSIYCTEIQNIQCQAYVGEGNIDAILYVSYDILTNISDQLVPCLDEIYIRYINDTPKIFFGEIDARTQNYINDARKRDDIQALIAQRQLLFQEALTIHTQSAALYSLLQ